MISLKLIKLVLVLTLASFFTLSGIGCKERVVERSGANDNVLVKGAHAADERLAISQLRAIHRAEELYRGENGSYASMDQLVDKGMLTRDPGGHLSYKYTIDAGSDRYQCVAVPQVYGTSGRYSFYIDQKGILYGGDHKGGPASAGDEQIN